MFIIKGGDGSFMVHFDAPDITEHVELVGNVRITLTPDKAKELEDRLEEALKAK